MKTDQEESLETKKTANGMQTAGKTSQAYWLPRVKKRVGLYGAQIQYKGERHYLTFTQDKHDSATKAGRAYAKLLAVGWEPVLDELGRVDRTEKSDKLPGTIGNYISVAETVTRVRPRTFGNYCRSLRMIASEITEMESSKKRFSAKGAKLWRGKIDQLPLSELTPTRIAAWQKSRLDQFVDEPIKQRSAKTTANTHVRQAKSLFGKRVLPLVSEQVEVPSLIPFSEVALFPQQSLRYQSALDPEMVLQEGMENLTDEPLKILTLALCAGLRAGEIDGLRWAQVDVKNGEIRIETTDTFEAKSEDSLGTVDLDEGFVALLRGWKAKAQGPFIVDSGNEKPPNWPGSFRAHEEFQTLYKWLRELEFDGKRPLEGVNKPLHTLRKEAGSLVNQRHGLAAASMFLRHADIGITARYYVAKKERLTTGLLAGPKNVSHFEDASDNSKQA